MSKDILCDYVVIQDQFGYFDRVNIVLGNESVRAIKRYAKKKNLQKGDFVVDNGLFPNIGLPKGLNVVYFDRENNVLMSHLQF